MTRRPCAADPDLWFGYADDDSSDGAAKARVYEQSATKARTICLRQCPLAAQRMCAAQAVDAREEYGVWGGLSLPGDKSTPEMLEAAYDYLLAQFERRRAIELPGLPAPAMPTSPVRRRRLSSDVDTSAA